MFFLSFSVVLPRFEYCLPVNAGRRMLSSLFFFVAFTVWLVNLQSAMCKKLHLQQFFRWPTWMSTFVWLFHNQERSLNTTRLSFSYHKPDHVINVSYLTRGNDWIVIIIFYGAVLSVCCAAKLTPERREIPSFLSLTSRTVISADPSTCVAKTSISLVLSVHHAYVEY